MNIDTQDPAVAALIEALPTAPGDARDECLMRCALDNMDDDIDFSYSFDENGRRGLRGAV